jgi:hypothetical protein
LHPVREAAARDFRAGRHFLRGRPDAGHPTITSRADLLRQDVWDRWRAGQGLTPANAHLTGVIGKLADIADRLLAMLERAELSPAIQQPTLESRQVDRLTPRQPRFRGQG